VIQKWKHEDLAPSFDSDGNFLGMVTPNRADMELDEEMDLPVMLPGTKEKERIKVDPGTNQKNLKLLIDLNQDLSQIQRQEKEKVICQVG
jgi:hypothetical protein